MSKINKLQLRAEIIKQINTLKISDLYATNGDKALELIKSFDKKENTIDILLKELKNSDGDITQIIAYLILELSNLDDVQDELWNYIKDSQVNDYIKEVACSILRAQGGSITIEELSSYLNNPEEIIDAETKKLLEESFQNPEALIDFLDFLFALNEDEQIMLLDSLKEDYPQNYVANVLIPALNSNPSLKIKEEIISMLGDTKTELAVKPLNNIFNYSDEKALVKKAQKSLNMLKLSGINIDKAKKLQRETLCTQDTKPYKSYSTTIDGAGNQGFIVSRLRDDDSIQMFSAVINDIDGIIDCFGFNYISSNEFERIIKKLEVKSIKIEPSFEYIKRKLKKAEKINKKNNYPIPYEFVAWKELLNDVQKMEESPQKLADKWADDLLYPDYSLLKSDLTFETWFLEEEDNIKFKELIGKVKTNLCKKTTNLDVFIDSIEQEIENSLNSIFDNNLVKIFIGRLEESAYLLNCQDKINLRNITSSLAAELKTGININKIDFFKDILKKSVYENFLRDKEIIEENSKTKTIFETNTQKKVCKFQKEELDTIINKLFERWEN